MANSKNIFVTVGTTKFDKLIKTVTKREVLQLFKDFGYENLTLQIGNGIVPPNSDIIKIHYYRLKESINEDLRNADLVISHAGAGSCLEILNLRKPMIAVINDDLMGNHQIELAMKLAQNKYIYYCTCTNITNSLKNYLRNLNSLGDYPMGNINLFSNYVDKCIGFQM